LDVCQTAVVGVREGTFKFAPNGSALVIVPARAGEAERTGELDPADLRALHGYQWQYTGQVFGHPAACIECHAFVGRDGCRTCAAVRPVWQAILLLDVIAFLEWWNASPGKVSLAALPDLARKVLTRPTRTERDDYVKAIVKARPTCEATVAGFLVAALAWRERQPHWESLVGDALDAYIHIRGRIPAAELDKHLEDEGPGCLLRVDQTGHVFRGPKQAKNSTRPIQARAQPATLGGPDLEVRVGPWVRPGTAKAALEVFRKRQCAGCGEQFTTDDRREKYCRPCGSDAGRKALARA
jgi:hypothetical protein